jgi:hypothetical protein
VKGRKRTVKKEMKKQMKKTLAAIALACIVFSVFSAIAPSVKGLADSDSSTATAPILPPNIEVSANTTLPHDLTPNTPISPKTEKIRFNFNYTMLSTPVVERLPNGSYTWTLKPMWNNHWWIVDYWATIIGTGMPSYMYGTFLAVPNPPIGGLVSGDSILYLPLNVIYGTSSTNCVWFQFDIQFNPGGSVDWLIWDVKYPFQDSDYASQDISDHLSYTPGHTYSFALWTYGTNIVIFYIADTTTGASWTNSAWDWPIPGVTMIYSTAPGHPFSPASAIEGRTTNNQLTNVPYFQTYLGYGENTVWEGVYGQPGPVPSGIDTFFYSGPINYYYWAMISTNVYTISSVYYSAPYGKGSVSNPNNIVGTPDGQYAGIYGGNPGDGGQILGNMNAPSGGYVYAYVYSTAGYYSDLYVYVSYDGQSWSLVGGTYKTISSSTPSWVYMGRSPGTFRYMAVVGYDSGNSVNLHVDAVKASG